VKSLCFLLLALSNLNDFKGNAQSLLISEFQARNAFTIADNFQEYDDWIEIANISNQDVNLNGYYITDDMDRKSRFLLLSTGNELIVPPGGYLILWADDDNNQGYNHLNFNISGKPGLIALFSPSLQLIDSVNYVQQYMDISMGRIPESPYTWSYFLVPTPGGKNSTQPFRGVLGAPGFNIKSGFYNAPINLTISPSGLHDSVYYTLNNTTPTDQSWFYQRALAVEKSKVINAIDKKSGFISSNVTSQVYFLRPSFSLPVIAVLIDSLNLFGPKGIYTNYDKPWEKFCQINYIANETLTAKANAGIRIQGASSTFMPKKAFRLFFRSDYGDSKFVYPIFGVSNATSFDKLVLKPGYDDDITTETGTLLRDALALELWKKSGGLPQLSSWVILYLNNRYWGIYNLRESIDEYFIKEHTNLVDFDLVWFRNEGPESVYGSLVNWNMMYDLVRNTDLTTPENYQNLAEIIDMDALVNLMAFIQCTVYYSWGWGVSMFRENSVSARWSVSIWDADRAFNNPAWNGFQEAMDKTNDLYWANNIPKHLMASSAFKQKYANRLHELLQTVFKPENAIAVLDSLVNIVSPEIADELTRWAPDNDNWEYNVEKIREFLRRRPAVVYDLMKDYLPLVTGSEISITQPCYIRAFPNPFNDQTSISFCLKTKGKVDISVYDQDGRLIKNMFSGIVNTEEKTMIWDGDSNDGPQVPPGLYIIRITTPDELYHTKILRR